MRTDVSHFKCEMDGAIATVSLDRPERKNPLTFDSYAEMRDWFRELHYDDEVKAVILAPNGGNFSSGGDVVKAMIGCGKPIIAAVDGVSAGAGAIIAMASDLRISTPSSKTAFLFNRVGLAGCDMGACAMLPRIIGQGRASELLYLGRSMTAEEGHAWGYFNAVVEPDALMDEARKMAGRIASGPTFSNMMTKTMLAQEWSMSLDQAIEAEAQAQAICMQGQDFTRAYEAFIAGKTPVFEGD